MKKWIYTTVMAGLLLLPVTSANSEAANEYKGFPTVPLILNGQPLTTEVPALNVDGKTLVPLRVIAENLQAKVDWKPENGSVEIQTVAATTPAAGTTPSPAPAAPTAPTAPATPTRTNLKKINLFLDNLNQKYDNMQKTTERILLAKQSVDLAGDYSFFQKIRTELKDKRNWVNDWNAQILKLQSESDEGLGKDVGQFIPFVANYTEMINLYVFALDSYDRYNNTKADADLKSYIQFLNMANEKCLQSQNDLSGKILEFRDKYQK